MKDFKCKDLLPFEVVYEVDGEKHKLLVVAPKSFSKALTAIDKAFPKKFGHLISITWLEDYDRAVVHPKLNARKK